MSISDELIAKAKAGDASAEAEYATALYSGDGLAQDFTEAFAYYEKAAASGHGWSRYMLGVMCQEGQGVEKDIPKAIGHYDIASEKGVSLAAMNTGILYQVGAEGQLDPDWASAAKCYEKAAEMGSENAAFNLAALYHTGINGDPDYKSAYDWYQRAAEMGHPNATLAAEQVNAILDPRAAALKAVAKYRQKPTSLWDRLVGRR